MKITRIGKNAPRVTRDQKMRAIEFVKEALGKGERRTAEMRKEAEIRGITWQALYKAEQELRVKKRKKNGIRYVRLAGDARYGNECQEDGEEKQKRIFGRTTFEWIEVLCECEIQDSGSKEVSQDDEL